MKKISLIILALMLTLTLAFVVSCDDECETPSANTQSSTVGSGDNGTDTESEIPAQGLWANAIYRKDTALGEGEKTFTLEFAAEGKSITFTIKTNAKTVGDALLELNLLQGTPGNPGMYINKVNGIVADWNVDKTYWAFYIDGNYAMSGVDSTDIVNGTTYKLSCEK